MAVPSTNPSVSSEPHLSDGLHAKDTSEIKAELVLAKRKNGTDEIVEHTVWDEPTLSGRLAGPTPDTAVTYETWLLENISSTSTLKSWLATVLLTLAAGPWAILGVFLLAFQGRGGFGAVAVVIFGPVTEEMLKITAALITVEKRPYIFKSAAQIVICCVASGLVFAFVENLLYLHVYVPHPSEALVVWRWTVCVALHSGCAAISSVGLVKMWSDSIKNSRKPRTRLMAGYVMTACVIHGTYNLTAILIDPLLK